MVNGTAYRGPEVEETSKGSAALGILGALLGAVVGAVPWFLASAFTSFFIGYLGFLIGWAAAFGYGKLHGRRSYAFAMTTVVVCSVAALVLADLASNMFSLCTDSEWRLAAEYYGVPVAELAFFSIIDPENLHIILPNLIMGLLIGLLGVASCRQYVRNYAQFGQVSGRPNAPINPAVAGAANGWTQPASTGLELPRQFTVRVPRQNLVTGIVMVVLFGLIVVLGIGLDLLIELNLITYMGADSLLFILICAWLPILAVVLILQGKNWRLEVDGERLCAYTWLGKATEFCASDIAGVSVPSMLNGRARLYGREGQVLFKFTSAMRNLPLLMQYLAEHNIPLRG